MLGVGRKTVVGSRENLNRKVLGKELGLGYDHAWYRKKKKKYTPNYIISPIIIKKTLELQ